MTEYLDVIDESGEKTGQAVSYEEAHEKGIRYRTAHVWFLNSENQLLLQKRNSTRRAYPNHWDISASGHISAGETSIEAARKETREELGLDLPDSSFELLFTVQEHVTLNEDSYIANEFQDVYLVRKDLNVEAFNLEAEEVEKARWISLDEFRTWIEGQGESGIFTT